MNDEQLLRYSRQMMLPEIDAAGQERLNESRVLIIGLGGLGSPVSIYLSSAGVGRLVLVDFDKVEISNLQRQIVHTTPDINRLKIESAKEHLQAINPEISIECIDHVMENHELLDQATKADVIVDASDNFQTRFALNEASIKTKTPLVSGAAIRFEGQVTVFNPKDDTSPCYRCLYGEEITISETCMANGVIAPLLGIIGSIQANETLKLLMGIGKTLQGNLLLLDSLHMDINQVSLKKDPACPVCS
ncbi:MAG: molybdopterin-synthase adenylyltransferase MoeB [Legionellales bacterium]|nr:molybdopterin-synthase adenylyltransferase MoeB [Legionellales bacterium]|tara:strand:- start:2192 stop:2932 length:741 start_codon:yes stop_codon:yes gene_type:complete